MTRFLPVFFILMLVTFNSISVTAGGGGGGGGGNPSNTDCNNATLVCTDQTFSGNSNGAGTQELTASNAGCLAFENQSSWYTFTAQTSGTIQFDIITDVDYDFAIWGPNPDCNNLGSPIRCNFSGTFGNTGLNTSANQNSVGAAGSPYSNELNVIAGQT